MKMKRVDWKRLKEVSSSSLGLRTLERCWRTSELPDASRYASSRYASSSWPKATSIWRHQSPSHEKCRTTVLKRPKNSCRCSQWDTNDEGLLKGETQLNLTWCINTSKKKGLKDWTTWAKKTWRGGNKIRLPRPFVFSGQICKLMKLLGVYHQVINSITPKTFCQRSSKCLVSITKWLIALLQRPFVKGVANILRSQQWAMIDRMWQCA